MKQNLLSLAGAAALGAGLALGSKYLLKLSKKKPLRVMITGAAGEEKLWGQACLYANGHVRVVTELRCFVDLWAYAGTIRVVASLPERFMTRLGLLLDVAGFQPRDRKGRTLPRLTYNDILQVKLDMHWPLWWRRARCWGRTSPSSCTCWTLSPPRTAWMASAWSLLMEPTLCWRVSLWSG